MYEKQPINFQMAPINLQRKRWGATHAFLKILGETAVLKHNSLMGAGCISKTFVFKFTQKKKFGGVRNRDFAEHSLAALCLV